MEDPKDISDYLEVEAKEDSDGELHPDGSLTCRVCCAKFKTRSGWKNHKVTHQKFRTKRFACYVCFRRFYWDKDCRRHVKNVHSIEHYDVEESRAAAVKSFNSNISGDISEKLVPFSARNVPGDHVDENKGITNYETHVNRLGNINGSNKKIDLGIKTSFLKMKLQMVKCKKRQLNNATYINKNVRLKEETKCDDLKSSKPEDDNSGIGQIGTECADETKREPVIEGVFNNNIRKATLKEGTNMNMKAVANFSEEVILVENGVKIEKNVDVEKNYECQDCTKIFQHLKSLKAHIRTCSAPLDSPYLCNLCDRRFIDFDKLQRHWKVNHKRQQMI